MKYKKECMSIPSVQIQGRMQMFKKLIKIEVPQLRDDAHLTQLEKLFRNHGLTSRKVPGK